MGAAAVVTGLVLVLVEVTSDPEPAAEPADTTYIWATPRVGGGRRRHDDHQAEPFPWISIDVAEGENDVTVVLKK